MKMQPTNEKDISMEITEMVGFGGHSKKDIAG